jgi:signal transduction histidine kinase
VTETTTDPAGHVAEQMRLLLHSIQDLDGAEDLVSVLNRTLRLACDVADARYGAVGVIDETDPRRITHFVTMGLTAQERDAIGDPPEGRGLLGRLLERPEAVRVEDLTQEPDSVGFPPGHPPMRTFLGMPVRIGGRTFGNLYLTEKRDGRAFTERDELLVQGLASVAGVVIDAVQRRQQTETQREVVDAVWQINSALLGTADPEDTLPMVTDQALRVTDAAAAAVVASGPTGEAARVLASSGVDTASVVADLHLEITSVLASGEPLHIPLDRERVTLDADLGPRHTSVVPVTLRNGDRVALVVAHWRSAPAMSSLSVRDLVGSLAVQTALVLDRASSARDHDTLTKLTDRDRIARDLHDLVIQRLFATGLYLQGATRLTREPAVVDRLESSIHELDATIRDIRATIFALQHRPFEGSLRSQLRGLADSYTTTLGFPPVTQFSGPLDSVLADDVHDALLLVLREALSNVARHAQARSVLVEVQTADEWLVLTVTDDGVGLAPGAGESGLRNVRQRAAALGGRATVGPHGTQGTRLRWEIPLGS